MIFVSEALLSDEELCGHFAPLAGKALRHAAGDANWPRDLTWAHQRQLFEAARDVRREQSSSCSKLACGDCGTLFLTSGSWRHHVNVEAACEKRIRQGRGQLWTPLERRAFPSIASTDDAALAARQLPMLDEGGGAEGSESSGEGDADEGSESS